MMKIGGTAKSRMMFAGSLVNHRPGGARKQKDGSVIHVDGGNANYAWIQNIIHHLNPEGTTGFVMANGSMSTNTSNEEEIRKAIIEDDGIPFEEKMAELTDKLYEQMREAEELDNTIKKNLAWLGFGE